MIDIAVAVIGWTGVALMLFAYGMVSVGRLSADSIAYQVLNALGAGAFIVNSGWHGAMPSAFTNVIWMAIALFALVRVVKARRRRACATSSGTSDTEVAPAPHCP